MLFLHENYGVLFLHNNFHFSVCTFRAAHNCFIYIEFTYKDVPHIEKKNGRGPQCCQWYRPPKKNTDTESVCILSFD